MIIKFSDYYCLNKHRFINVADEWAKEAFPTLAYRTLSCYSAPLKHAKQYFLRDYIEDITHSDIKSYMDM